MSIQKRSPLKDKPLRNPGQSLELQLDEMMQDKLLIPLIVAWLLFVIAFLEWWRYLYPSPPSPFLATVCALSGISYAAWTIYKYVPKFRALKLARDGEKVVGQFLERLRGGGYQVFHDVIGTGFNVDHVIVGPAGVFTIETKTYSKTSDSKVLFDGETLTVDGFKPDRDPVVQAKAQSNWMSQLLAESTGRKFPVRPVILFPGWWVEQSKGSTREVWVLEPKALSAFLGNQPVVMSPEDVKLVSFHLSRFIRTSES